MSSHQLIYYGLSCSENDISLGLLETETKLRKDQLTLNFNVI